MKTKHLSPIALLAFLIVILPSCSKKGIVPSATSESTRTPSPTPTPTNTIKPTATLMPTATLIPTITPTPSVVPNSLGIDWTIDCEDDDFTNGYWYHEYCLPGIVSKDFHLSTGPRHYVGAATYYDEGVMENVAEVRGLSMNGYWGGIATMFCGNIGKKAYLKPSPQDRWQGPFIVLDCSARQHLYYHIMINQIGVEVDWNTWNRWKSQGWGMAGVHVCLTYPDCGPAVTLQSYFKNLVEWERSTNE